MHHQSTLRIGGAVSFWSLSEYTSQATLKQGLESLGLAKFVPAERTNTAVLFEALGILFPTNKHIIRPLEDRDGFVVVEEARGKHDNTYKTELSARIDDQDNISITPWTFAIQAAINEQFEKQRGLLRATAVTSVLTTYIGSLGGTRLRPNGAIYWLADGKLGQWQSVARVVEAASAGGKSAVYLIRHQMDADAIRAVRDAIVAEVTVASAKIKEDIEGGLGERALEHRKEQALELREKIVEYEQLLGIGLQSLRDTIEEATQSATLAAIMESAASSVA